MGSSSDMVASFLNGIRRVVNAPALLVGVYLVTLAATVPMALALHVSIASHLGNSVAADTAATGVNAEWWEEFGAQATGIERTFTPSIIGFAAVLSNLSAFLDNVPLSGGVAAVAVAYLVVWAFLVGGVIDRLARQRPVLSAGFFSACGIFFFRFCRLAALVGLMYWVLLGPVHSWLLDDLYRSITRDLTVERTAFIVRLTLYVIFGTLLVLINLVVDYAKIRAVVEDRRSMIGALLAALRFARRRPVSTIGLYLLNGTLFLAVLFAYALVAPGAGTTGPSMWGGFLVGQAYVIARLFSKLVFYASQTAFFQSQLAHAGYVAAPRPTWPESPAAEAIGGTVT